MFRFVLGGEKSVGKARRSGEERLEALLSAVMPSPRVAFMPQGTASSRKADTLSRIEAAVHGVTSSVFLLVYSGPTDEAGDWAVGGPGDAPVTLLELLRLWQATRRHGQRLVVVADARGSGQWVEQLRGLPLTEQVQLSVSLQASDCGIPGEGGPPHQACAFLGSYLNACAYGGPALSALQTQHQPSYHCTFKSRGLADAASALVFVGGHVAPSTADESGDRSSNNDEYYAGPLLCPPTAPGPPLRCTSSMSMPQQAMSDQDSVDSFACMHSGPIQRQPREQAAGAHAAGAGVAAGAVPAGAATAGQQQQQQQQQQHARSPNHKGGLKYIARTVSAVVRSIPAVLYTSGPAVDWGSATQNRGGGGGFGGGGGGGAAAAAAPPDQSTAQGGSGGVGSLVAPPPLVGDAPLHTQSPFFQRLSMENYAAQAQQKVRARSCAVWRYDDDFHDHLSSKLEAERRARAAAGRRMPIDGTQALQDVLDEDCAYSTMSSCAAELPQLQPRRSVPTGSVTTAGVATPVGSNRLGGGMGGPVDGIGGDSFDAAKGEDGPSASMLLGAMAQHTRGQRERLVVQQRPMSEGGQPQAGDSCGRGGGGMEMLTASMLNEHQPSGCATPSRLSRVTMAALWAAGVSGGDNNGGSEGESSAHSPASSDTESQLHTPLEDGALPPASPSPSYGGTPSDPSEWSSKVVRPFVGRSSAHPGGALLRHCLSWRSSSLGGLTPNGGAAAVDTGPGGGGGGPQHRRSMGGTAVTGLRSRRFAVEADDRSSVLNADDDDDTMSVRSSMTETDFLMMKLVPLSPDVAQEVLAQV
ncbi:hypothetical protein FOA52_006317 [Chlamydomonas sp. UWO 241]|nr:hypothetical protein FOA52_006317 [Chlamydomonas sp. UWO 241]